MFSRMLGGGDERAWLAGYKKVLKTRFLIIVYEKLHNFKLLCL